MGRIIQEEQFINSSIFKYEDRMNGQYSRFLDKMPTYVTYYHISNTETTVDNGFENVERYVGDNSPIRFNKIENFPIYGLEQIILQLSDEDEGLTTSYEGTAVILPNTIKPLPCDFFIINHLKIKVQFIVNELSYDTIKSNNFYSISFNVKSLSDDDKLDNQVVDTFKCITTNIGTDDKCLIKEEEYYKLIKFEEEIDRLEELFKLFFYNPKFNLFVVNDKGIAIHDPALTRFMINNGLFNNKNRFDTIIPSLIGDERNLLMDYNLSIFNKIDRIEIPKYQNYTLYPDNDMSSPFNYYGERAYIVGMNGNHPYLPKHFFDVISSISLPENCPYIFKIITLYLHGKIESINQIEIDKLNKYTISTIDRESMIINAILLVVLKNSYQRFMSNKF